MKNLTESERFLSRKLTITKHCSCSAKGTAVFRHRKNQYIAKGLMTLMVAAAWGTTMFAAPLPDGPAPAGKAWEPAWGYWTAAPTSWLPTHMGHVKRIQAGPTEVLFLGDSLTKGWEGAGKETWDKEILPLHAVDAGIGGDTTRQVLWRLDNGLLDGVHPKVIVLMIGVNNIFTNTGTDEDIAKGIEAIVAQIQTKSPGTKILLLGVLPLGNSSQSARAKAINAMIGKLAGSQVRFLDMTSKFQDAQGNVVAEYYSPDKIHLAKQGYEVWGATMGPVLKEML